MKLGDGPLSHLSEFPSLCRPLFGFEGTRRNTAEHTYYYFTVQQLVPLFFTVQIFSTIKFL
jgi:hypothetical protein